MQFMVCKVHDRICGRPDINALLDQFVHEKQIFPELTEGYRETARLDITSLAYGSTYVPAKVAIEIQQENKPVKVVWDMREDRVENYVLINPQYLTYILYKKVMNMIQLHHSYHCSHIMIKNTSMLLELIAKL